MSFDPNEMDKLNSGGVRNYSTDTGAFNAPPPYNPNACPNMEFDYGRDPDALPPGVTNNDLLPYQDNSGPTMPSAPMEPVPGYPEMGFSDVPVGPPPRYTDIDQYIPKHRPEIKGTSVVTEDEARGALVCYCNSQCCWGTGAAKQMNINNMKTTDALQYYLESFCEKRSSAWASTPYAGQHVDGPNYGYPPLPWDIPATFTEKFKTEKRLMEVPHTASIRPCEACRGRGLLRCTWCHGFGRVSCNFCHGSSHMHMGGGSHHSGHRHVGQGLHHSCSSCHGSGRRHCSSCHGSGHIRCKTCIGRGSLKWFVQLTIQWISHFEDFILERTDLPDELIRGVLGNVAFQEENVRVFPITHCPEPSINNASADLITKHATAYQNERLLLQRQTVRIVPVTEVDAVWKEKTFRFFVYGLDKKIYTDNYLQTKCCGCSIV